MLMGGGLVGRDLKRVPEEGEEVIVARPQGKDSVPVILQPGELVVNKANVPRVLPLLEKYGIEIPGLKMQEAQYGDDFAAMAKGGKVKISSKRDDSRNTAIARGRGARASINRSKRVSKVTQKQKVTQKVTINIGRGGTEEAAEDLARSSSVQRPGLRGRGLGSGLGVRQAPGPGLASWPAVVAALGPAQPVVPNATVTPAVAAAPVPALPVPGAPAAAPAPVVALPPTPAATPAPFTGPMGVASPALPPGTGDEDVIDFTQIRIPRPRVPYMMGFMPDRRVRFSPAPEVRIIPDETPRITPVEEPLPTPTPPASERAETPAPPTLLPEIPSTPASEGMPSPPPELAEAPPADVAAPAAAIPLPAPQTANAVEAALDTGNRVLKRDLARYIYERREAYGFPARITFTSINQLPANYLLGIVDMGGYGGRISPLPGLSEQFTGADARTYLDEIFREDRPPTWAEIRARRV